MSTERLSDISTGASYESVFKMLEERINTLEQHLEWDAEIRRQNPALQDLYEKFQATKKLVTK